MQIVGVTGGIGSGKTSVCKIFETLGIPVYYADERAKALMQADPEVVSSIKDLLGANVYDREGKLNKSAVGQQIFHQPEKLKKLNAIVHPATIRDSMAWAKKQSSPYVLKETALLFETAAFHHVDKAIGVTAPVALRIRRTMKRDHISREEVLKRMESQLDDEIKMRLCDFVVVNNGREDLKPQVVQIHKKLCSL